MRAPSAALAAALLLLILPAGASAAWYQPADVSSYEPPQFGFALVPYPQVAMAPNGDATVMYGEQPSGSANHLRSRVRRNGTTSFEASKLVTEEAGRGQLRQDGDGDLTAAWVGGDLDPDSTGTSNGNAIRVASAAPGGDWTGHATLLAPVGNQNDVEIMEFDVAPDGKAAMLVQRCTLMPNGGQTDVDCELMVGTRSAAGAWSAFQQLDRNECHTFYGGDVALDAAGNVTAAWGDPGCGSTFTAQLYAASGTVGSTTWTAPQPVGDLGASVHYFPSVAVVGGTPTIAWERWAPTKGAAMATRNTDGSWPVPTPLSSGVGGRPQVEADNAGNLVFKWEQGSGDDESVRARRKAAGGALGDEVILGTGTGGRLVLDNGGEAAVGFHRITGDASPATAELRIARMSAAGAWSSSEQVTSFPLKTGPETAFDFRAGVEAVAAWGYLDAEDAGRVAASWDAAPKAQLGSSSLSFSSPKVGQDSASQKARITNVGNAPMHVTGVTLQGPFVGDTPTCVKTLAANEFCEVTVSYRPSAGVSETGSLSFTTDAEGSPHTVALTGTTPGPQPAFPTGMQDIVNYGTVQVGQTSGWATFTLQNTGGAPFNVTSLERDAWFQVENASACGKVDPGQSCSIRVRFAPTEVGQKSGSLVFKDDVAGEDLHVTLLGNGAAAPGPVASVSPSQLDFGRVEAAGTSGAFAIVVKNTGGSALQVSGVGVSGPFTIANPGDCNTLAPAASCNVLLRFIPRDAGPASGTLTVDHNGPGGKSTVALSGTGTAKAGPPAKPAPAAGGGKPAGPTTEQLRSGAKNAAGKAPPAVDPAKNLKQTVESKNGGETYHLGLIGQAGGNLIGQAGGNIISDNGGGLITDAGGGFRPSSVGAGASAKRKKKPKRKLVVLMRGRHTFQAPGTKTITARRSKTGKKLFKRLRASAKRARRKGKKVRRLYLTYIVVAQPASGGTAYYATKRVRVKL